MAREMVVDLSGIDLAGCALDQEGVRAINPQRYEMEHLDGVIWYDADRRELVGFKEVREDEFWVRGHIPGRPLLPGVLMIEAAAQLASVGYKLFSSPEDERFVGFGGVTDVKFRRAVTPPARLLLLGKCTELRSRRAVFETQGVVEGGIVFEATIIGMPM